MFRGKIVIIGAGCVGSTVAYTIMLGGLFGEIAIIDTNHEKAKGDAEDMLHAASFIKPTKVYAAGYESCADADIIVITAGAGQREGENRLDLLKKNYEILKDITANIMEYAPKDVILLMVTNPVDILTYAAFKLTGLPKNQVLGSGTVLDTSRLKYMISKYTGVDARNCHAYVIGEHGDSEVAAWSVTSIAGMSMEEYSEKYGRFDGEEKKNVYEAVKNAAYGIIKQKGATNYAIALAVSKIVGCIARGENSVLTVSAVLEGEYGIDDICLSVPAMVGINGVEGIFEVDFSEEEKAMLKRSAELMKKAAKEIL